MQNEKTVEDVIRAAGGLVWRDSADGKGKELAVIRRKRDSGEGWTLPKGKVIPEDKTWKEAAEREVGEETGWEVCVNGFVGCNSYTVNGTPKVVLYWNMSLTGKPHSKDSGEVKEVQWMTPKQAHAALHYTCERALLCANIEALDCPVICGQVKAKWWWRFTPWNRRSERKQDRTNEVKAKWWKSTSWNRLASSLPAFRFELEHFISRKEQSDSSWATTAQSLLNEASKALRVGDAELGWKCFLAAQRVELFGLTDIALQVRASSILNEAIKKLDDWRKKSVVDLLADKQAQEPDAVVLKANITVEKAYEASLILHEHYGNLGHKLRFHRRLLGVLALIAGLAAVGAAIVLRGILKADSPLSIWSVMLFGIMGASFSGILSLSKGVGQARIPEQLATSWVTLARLVAGIVSALAAYFFLHSRLLNTEYPVSPHLILAVSFAAGFSERLVVRAVETLSQR